MSNFANQVEINGIHQYENIFNTIVESRKLLVEPTPTDHNAVQYVEQVLVASGWNQPGVNRDRIIKNLARTTISDLNYYLYEEVPSDDTRIRELINKIWNYINNNDVARGRKRKSRKSKKSKKYRKSKKSRKSRKSRN